MQVWDSVKVKDDNKKYAGLAGRIQAVNGDFITVKLDLVDKPFEFDVSDLVRL